MMGGGISVDGVLNWAVSTGLSISLLIVFILIIRRPVARRFGARAAYALWSLPVIRLFIPDIKLAILPQDLNPSAASIDIVPATANLTVPVSRIETVLPLISDPLKTGEATGALAMLWTPTIWLAVWLLGVGVYICANLWRQRQFMRRLQAHSLAVSPMTRQNLRNICQRARVPSPPKLLQSTAQDGPLVAGFVRPVIIVPHDFEVRFSPEQQNFALLHEVCHIRRGDLWAAWGVMVFRALNWPNPLMYPAFKAFRADQEGACDSDVIRLSRNIPHVHHEYAQTLLHAAISTQGTHMRALSLTMHHPLKERLMNLKTSPTRKGAISTLVLILAVSALSAPLSLAQSAKVKPETVLAGAPSSKSVNVQKITDTDTLKTVVIKDVNGQMEATETDIKTGVTRTLNPQEIEAFKAAHPIPDHPHPPHPPHHPDIDFHTFDFDTEAFATELETQLKAELNEAGVLTEGLEGQIQAEIDKAFEREFKIFADTEGRVSKKVTIKNMDIDGIKAWSEAYSADAEARAMLSAAYDLLQTVDRNVLKAETLKALKKAQKALAKAQDTLESREQ